ncbi:MAG TPA: carbon-nitrogen hydrolase family protein [Microlunatus sp.]
MSEVAESTIESPPSRLRVAVAQTNGRSDPRDPELLRRSGAEIRELIKRAHTGRARLAHFPEGALSSPDKRVMSSDPDRVADADWSAVDWDTYRAELRSIAQLAAKLGIWVALPAMHELSGGHRPHNSLYVINDRGNVETRYDERFMSQTKVTYMYTPGREPITFVVDGLRIGCTLGIEAVHSESFTDYERRGADLVLFSTTGGPTPASNPTPFFRTTSVYAEVNDYWISLAQTVPGVSAIFGPGGAEPATCVERPEPAVAFADVLSSPNAPWRERLRSGIYEEHQVADDARSLQRTSF